MMLQLLRPLQFQARIFKEIIITKKEDKNGNNESKTPEKLRLQGALPIKIVLKL